MAEFCDLEQLDIRVGTVVKAEGFPKAKKPVYKVWVDFGQELGVKKSSAQLTELYQLDELVGKQVLGVVNFPDKQIADFLSEVLLLGVYTENGVVLIVPLEQVKNGSKIG